MTVGLKTRPLGPDDLDAIRHLYNQVWGYSRPADYDLWRYFGSPDGHCPLTGAFEGDRIVGFYSLWPVRLRIGAEIVLGGQSMDTMTHPDYRGQGIFTMLANECYELAAEQGYQFYLWFSKRFQLSRFYRSAWLDSYRGHHPLDPSIEAVAPSQSP